MNEYVFFVHSVGTSPTLWSNVPPEAIGSRQALFPANVGYAPNPPLPRGQTFLISDEVQHLLRQLPANDSRVHIVAHSYGATVALAMAEEPRLKDRLASMVLAEPVLFGSLIADHDGYLRETMPEAVSSALDFVATPVLKDEEKGGGAEWLEVFIDYWNRPGAWLRMPEAMKQQQLAMGWKMFQEVRACFGADKPFRDYAIHVPTTLVMGALTTIHSRAMTHSLGHAHSLKVVELPKTSHMAPLTHPALVHAAIAEHFSHLPRK